ncbi:MAG: rRNA cytosine-C5-methyltransferase [Bacteroidaceae bacterium]|nr:rRNA cytosine-C5-methyltransferase [Bacteroidaceae bacterium]
MEQTKIIPEDFRTDMEQFLGSEEAGRLEKSLLGSSPVSVRWNPAKTGSAAEAFGIDECVVESQVPWSDYGVYLAQRPPFTFDPLLHAGCYYVQEAGSMFIERAIRQYVTEPSRVLDLCAAPGGKSIAALSALPERSMLVANEIMRQRVQILAENLTKTGCPSVIVTNNEAKDFQPLGPMFDVIITDVPCSGEGMFRKDQKAIDDWSTANVDLCWRRQRDILTDIWPCLREGGLLIYSTCTFNTLEDEQNVAWIARELGAEVLPVTIEEDWGITGNLTGEDFPVYHFFPHKTRGEGFFMAVLRRTAANDEFTPSKPRSKKKERKDAKPLPIPKESRQMLVNADDFDISWNGGSLVATPKHYAEEFALVAQNCRIVSSGIELGEQKGRDIVPSHQLAMSTALNRKAFPTVEIAYQQAIAYLRKEAIVLPADAPRGFVLLTYRSHPLGFVKNIGNRANNLYPQEWRIRSSHIQGTGIDEAE